MLKPCGNPRDNTELSAGDFAASPLLRPGIARGGPIPVFHWRISQVILNQELALQFARNGSIPGNRRD